jgi:hypothetical protein
MNSWPVNAGREPPKEEPPMKETPEHPNARADLVRGSITRRNESGSVIEDRLSALVDDSAGVDRFPADVFHPDVAAGQAG